MNIGSCNGMYMTNINRLQYEIYWNYLIYLTKYHDVTYYVPRKKEMRLIRSMGYEEKLRECLTIVEIDRFESVGNEDGSVTAIFDLSKIKVHDYFYLHCVPTLTNSRIRSIIDAFDDLNKFDELRLKSRFMAEFSAIFNVIPALVNCASSSCKVVQFSIDYRECFLNKYFDNVTMFGYNEFTTSKKEVIKYLPVHELTIFDEKFLSRYKKEKELNFTYGFTFLAGRKGFDKLIEKLLEMQSSHDKFELHYKSLNPKVDCTIPQEEYFDELAQSKVTLVTTGYIKGILSTFRLVESFAFKTLPIIVMLPGEDETTIHKNLLANGFSNLFLFYCAYGLIVSIDKLEYTYKTVLSEYDMLIEIYNKAYKKDFLNNFPDKLSLDIF